MLATMSVTSSRGAGFVNSRPRIARGARLCVASSTAAPALKASRPVQPASVDRISVVPFWDPSSKPALSDLLPAAVMSWLSHPALPPATGLAQPECLVARTRLAFHAGRSTSWLANKKYCNLNANVHPCMAGLRPQEVQQVVQEHFGAFELDAANVTMNLQASPATAAACVLCLAHDWAPVLSLVAPGGSSALASVATGLLAATEAAAAAATSLTAAGSFRAAFAIGAAGLQLLSHLSFGSSTAAAPYLAAALAFKAAITAAVSSGAVAVTERDVLALTAACASAHKHLHLTPWFGHTFAEAAHTMLSAGWSSGEVALQYVEAWSTMVASGRKQFVSDKYRLLVEAVLSHPRLTAAQLDRLLATERTLPAHVTCGVKGWLAAWEQQVLGRRERLALTAPAHAGSNILPRSPATLQQLSC